MKDLKVAVVCMRSEFGRIEKNMKRMETFVQMAAFKGARMICFPELSITGYSVRENLRQYNESIFLSDLNQMITYGTRDRLCVLP